MSSACLCASGDMFVVVLKSVALCSSLGLPTIHNLVLLASGRYGGLTVLGPLSVYLYV